jgi:hypothetical protein
MPLPGRENFKRARFAAGACRNLRNGCPKKNARRRSREKVGGLGERFRASGCPRILSDTRSRLVSLVSEDVLKVVADALDQVTA